MATSLRIQIKDDPVLASEAAQAIKEAGIEIQPRTPRVRGIPVAIEIVVALGSAGAFTVLYQVICRLLEKNKERELTVERKGMKIRLIGHSLLEEREFLEKLVPELTNRGTSKHTK